MVTKQQATLPPQHQNRQPGLQTEMNPQPISVSEQYKASGKLHNKVAIISGGDSGIGRAVAIHFAKEGADVAIIYLNEHEDAEETRRCVERCSRSAKRRCSSTGTHTRAIASIRTTWPRVWLHDCSRSPTP